ncbi:G-protein coupled receptor Mth isoform X2 [Drosophila willistoni]|uniref:G-protein coupled receptor Mth isoform X2 n=1 Tax=Drosophila willistoni TaxID=7260 RepID=UPI00017D77D4|nr:G-protein coupled receptor Mth isoform X2 [Drosophila willistoni]
MRILLYSLLAVLILNDFFLEPTKALDCNYYDTVDLTGIQPFKNGSYPYENIIIPADLIGEYDYRLTGVDDERIEVPKYIRGCACRLKSCVRFCCHHNLMFMNGECIGDTDKALEYDPYLNITTSDGSVVEKHVLNEFVVQRHLPLPCSEIGTYHLDDRIEGYEWSLFENGSFKRTFDGVSLDKREYCLQPVELPDREIRLVPHNCQIPSSSNIVPKIVIPISLVCFLITIVVYLYLPKLRNLHGKCFVCYLISLFIGYSMLLLDIYKACIYYYYLCYITGYLGYFGILAAFFWLTVISLDLWNSFRGTNYNVNRFTSGNRFLIYNLYAWGMPLVLTILIAILDQVLLDPYLEDLTWVPGVYYNGCWIKTFDWSAMVYFYGPMLILIIFNTILFILTAARIMVIKKDIHTVVDRQDRRRKINSEETYSLFARLVVIMGISWSLEIISYLVQHHPVWSTIFLCADYFHYAQGIVILVLFVLKRSVLKLFIDRITGRISDEEIDKSEEEMSLQEGNNIILS